MRVRKFFLIIFLTLFLLFPLYIQGKQFFVKLAFGLSSGGNVEDALLTQAKYSEYISIGGGGKPKLGQDIFLEFIYQLNPYISFSLGNGYTSKVLKGKDTQYSPPEIEHIIKGGYILSPEFSLDVIPVCFSVIFSYPASPTLRINLSGGAGYYFGTFESKTHWRTLADSGYGTSRNPTWNFEGKANTIGYHAGTGFDIDFFQNLILSVDVLYRKINFNNIKSSGEVGGDTTFTNFRFFEGGAVSADFDYRVSRVSFSGFSVRAGLKFSF